MKEMITAYLKDQYIIKDTDRIEYLCHEGQEDYKTISYTVFAKKCRKAYAIVTLDVDVVRMIVHNVSIEEV